MAPHVELPQSWMNFSMEKNTIYISTTYDFVPTKDTLWKGTLTGANCSVQLTPRLVVCSIIPVLLSISPSYDPCRFHDPCTHTQEIEATGSSRMLTVPSFATVACPVNRAIILGNPCIAFINCTCTIHMKPYPLRTSVFAMMHLHQWF